MAANTATHHSIGVRLPKPLYNRVAKRAAAEHRTLSNMVMLVLEQAFPEEKAHVNGHAHKAAKQHVAA
jgi:hypothetical protein